MASSISSVANQDDYSDGDAQSDLQSLTKLYGLLDPSKDINTPGTGEKILDEKSRILLRKMLDESTQRVLKCQARIFPISPFENKSRMKILSPKKEYIQHSLNHEKINYSPVPSFLTRNSTKTRQTSQPVDQSSIGNRATPRSIIKSNYPIKGNYKRTSYNKIKGGYNYNKIRPINLKEDNNNNIKGKSKEIFSDSETSSYYSDSYSSTSCDSVPSNSKIFAKRSEDYKKFAKRPENHSKSPIKDNKPSFKKIPSHNINKGLSKMASNNNNKVLIKVASHNKEAGKPKNPKDSTKNKEKKIIKEKNEKKESGFKKIKNKLAVIFYHHHHHHLHHADNIPNKKNNNKNIKKHHKSAWKFLKGMMHHKPSERGVEIAPRQHRHLSELFRVLAGHFWSNNKKKNKGHLLRGFNNNKNNKRSKLHWWPKFKKKGGVKLTNGKKTRLRLGFNKGT